MEMCYTSSKVARVARNKALHCHRWSIKAQPSSSQRLFWERHFHIHANCICGRVGAESCDICCKQGKSLFCKSFILAVDTLVLFFFDAPGSPQQIHKSPVVEELTNLCSCVCNQRISWPWLATHLKTRLFCVPSEGYKLGCNELLEFTSNVSNDFMTDYFRKRSNILGKRHWEELNDTICVWIRKG